MSMNPKSQMYVSFLQIIEPFGLKQHVSVPTHVAGHTLDLVITRDDCDFLSNSPQAHFMMTSHSTVLFKLNWTKPHRPAVTRSCRKIKEKDLSKFRSDLQSGILLQHPTENVHDQAFQYQSTLLAILDDHAPIISRRVAQRPRQPWFCCEIAEAKRRAVVLSANSDELDLRLTDSSLLKHEIMFLN